MDADLQSHIQHEISNALSTSQNNLMSEIKNLISSETGKMQTQQRSLADSQIAKIESTLTESYRFKKRGNEEQSKHNVKVLSKMKEVEDRISKGDIMSAREKIAEGIALVNHRQKLVKMADSSALGWKVVQEYEANPLADDSEDKKKMLKAENRAERKSKAEKTKKKTVRTHPYFSTSDASIKPNRPGRCFGCGDLGHWKRDCPQELKINRKISILLDKKNTDLVLMGSQVNDCKDNLKIGNCIKKIK